MPAVALEPDPYEPLGEALVHEVRVGEWWLPELTPGVGKAEAIRSL